MNVFGNRYFDKDDLGEVISPTKEELEPKVVDSPTPDIQEIDNELYSLEAKFLGNEPEPVNPPAKDTETKTDTPVSTDNNASKEVQTPETPKQENTQTPPEPPKTDTEKDTAKGLILTEEMLAEMNLDPKEARYAQKFLNKPLTELAKAYANSQQFIGKKKEDLLKTLPDAELPKQTVVNTNTSIPVPAKPQTEDEVKQAKEDLIYNQLVKDFPDLPKDAVERKAWLSTLNYEDRELADQYIEKKKALSSEVDKVWTETENLRKNQTSIIDNQIKQTLSEIGSFISDELGKKPEDFGYNLAVDDKGENDLINELLSDPNNPDAFDPKVVVNFNGVQLLNKDALVSKFIMNNRKTIIDKIRTEARLEGANSVKNPPPVAPSMATTNAGKGELKKEVTVDKVTNVNDVDKIDELLDNFEVKFNT